MEIIRGTPLLVQILIFFYVVADAFGIENRYFVGVVILAMFAGGLYLRNNTGRHRKHQ